VNYHSEVIGRAPRWTVSSGKY